MAVLGGAQIIDLKGKYNSGTKVYDDALAFELLKKLKGRKHAIVEFDSETIVCNTDGTEKTDASSKKYYELKSGEVVLHVYADKVVKLVNAYLPDMSELDDAKSYYLEWVEGTLTWVEIV